MFMDLLHSGASFICSISYSVGLKGKSQDHFLKWLKTVSNSHAELIKKQITGSVLLTESKDQSQEKFFMKCKDPGSSKGGGPRNVFNFRSAQVLVTYKEIGFIITSLAIYWHVARSLQ